MARFGVPPDIVQLVGSTLVRRISGPKMVMRVDDRTVWLYDVLGLAPRQAIILHLQISNSSQSNGATHARRIAATPPVILNVAMLRF